MVSMVCPIELDLRSGSRERLNLDGNGLYQSRESVDMPKAYLPGETKRGYGEKNLENPNESANVEGITLIVSNIVMFNCTFEVLLHSSLGT